MATATLPSLTGAEEQGANAIIQTPMPTAQPAEPITQGLPPVAQLGGEGSFAPGGATVEEPSPFKAMQRHPMEPAPQRSPEVQRVIDDLRAKSRQESSFWPMFLATAAALKGDFRPAMQLQEQKRQTALAIKLAPVTDMVRKYQRAGNFEDAQDLVTSVGAEVGDRSPELTRWFGEMSKGLADQAQRLVSMKTLRDQLKTTSEADPEVARMRAPIIKSLDEAIKTNQPWSAKQIEETQQTARVHTQFIDHMRRQSVEGTGATAEAAARMPAVTMAELNTPEVRVLAQKYRMSLGQIQNAINDIEMGKPPPPGAEELFQDFANTQLLTARREMREKFQLDPPLTTEMMMQPGGLESITYGYPPRSGYTQATANVAGRAKSVAEAQGLGAEQARQQQPFYVADRGMTIIDTTPTIDAFGTVDLGKQMMRVGELEDRIARGERLAPIREANLPKLHGGLSALQSVRLAQLMYEAQGDPKTLFDRGANYINRTISNYLGVEVVRGQTKAKVAELLVNRAIEDIAGTQLVNDATVGQLKALITGKLATSEGGLGALSLFQNRVLQHIKRTTGVTVPPEALAPREAREAVQPGAGGAPTAPAPAGKGRVTVPQGSPGSESPTSTFTRPATKGDVEGAINRARKKGATPAPQPEAPPGVPQLRFK